MASNLSELELTLGEVAGAVGDAEQSVSHADRSGDAFMRNTSRARSADARHQAGRRVEAEARFRETEALQAESQPDYPLLYSVSGFQYCDLLLAEAERAAWQATCSGGLRPPEDGDAQRAALQAVSHRATQTLKWMEAWSGASLFNRSLDHLTLGRAAFYAAILEGSSFDPCHAPLHDAVAGLRRAGVQDYLIRGLLTRAWLRFLEGHRTGPESAQSRPGRSLGNRRTRAHETPHGRHPPPPRPPLLPRSEVSLGIARRRSRRRARAHRAMRLWAAETRIGGCGGGRAESRAKMTGNKKLFLSVVSSELVSYRNLLAVDLKRPDLDVAVQEDFVVTGGTTLEKLDKYIRHCDAVIHLIGKAAGAVPEGPAVAALLAGYPDLGTRLPPLAEDLRKPQPGFSYTQWEAYLAIYHRRPLFVYRPTDFELDALHVPGDARFVFCPSEAQSQKEHYRRISALGHDRGLFLNEERLSSAVLRDLVEILPRLESTVHVSPTKLRHTAERLIGRDEDLSRLDAAWNDPHKNVVIVRAFGGMGKTSLVATWMAELALKNWRGAERVFDWSFYSQGTREQSAASADTFMAEALRAFGDPDPTLGSPWDRGARLASLVSESRCLLVLDGLEPLQHPPGPMEGQLKDAGIEALLKGLAARNAGLCEVTTREKVDDIKQHYGRTADDVPLTRLTDLAGAALLHYAGARRAGAMAIAPDDKELRAASREVRGHGLTLQLQLEKRRDCLQPPVRTGVAAGRCSRRSPQRRTVHSLRRSRRYCF